MDLDKVPTVSSKETGNIIILITDETLRDENIKLIKSEDLQNNPSIFHRTSKVLKRKMCCENTKITPVTLITFFPFVALFILIIYIVVSTAHKHKTN